MDLSPFPAMDLAKLVLGYLAEEQLMTAYDAFLQASPYLDALTTEYDRLCMTSLKSILAEYREVKIFVETSMPDLLRKRLFKCHNLLEVVKFLINHVDINKLQLLEAADKARCRQTNSSAPQCPNEASVSQNSTEATPLLTDLPDAEGAARFIREFSEPIKNCDCAKGKNDD